MHSFLSDHETTVLFEPQRKEEGSHSLISKLFLKTKIFFVFSLLFFLFLRPGISDFLLTGFFFLSIPFCKKIRNSPIHIIKDTIWNVIIDIFCFTFVIIFVNNVVCLVLTICGLEAPIIIIGICRLDPVSVLLCSFDEFLANIDKTLLEFFRPNKNSLISLAVIISNKTFPNHGTIYGKRWKQRVSGTQV